MSERLTESARRVVTLATNEALKMRVDAIGTEHLLLGLLGIPDCTAMKILQRSEIRPETIRQAVEREAPKGKSIPSGDLVVSAVAKSAMNLGYAEARKINNSYMDTANMLQGLYLEREEVAARIMTRFLDYDAVKVEILRLQDLPDSERVATDLPAATAPRFKELEKTAAAKPGPTWEAFTERARLVAMFAQDEARKLNENMVSTEHLLLGLLRDEDSNAARVLKEMNVSAGRLRFQVAQRIGAGATPTTLPGQLAARAKRAIDLGFQDAALMGKNYLGTEHILLGLVADPEGQAGRVFATVGINHDKATTAVRRVYGEHVAESSQAADMLKGLLGRLIKR